VLDVPTYGSEDEQISWKSSDDENDDEVNESKDDDDNAEDDDRQENNNEQNGSDNDGDDFVHPKLSTFDEEDVKTRRGLNKLQVLFMFQNIALKIV
nr:hypothetical protein [Tanacetum cinerariifolium]